MVTNRIDTRDSTNFGDFVWNNCLYKAQWQSLKNHKGFGIHNLNAENIMANFDWFDEKFKDKRKNKRTILFNEVINKTKKKATS